MIAAPIVFSSTRLLAKLATFVAVAAVGAGCAAPIEGEWESDRKLGNGQRNELSIFGDNTGEAEIYATPTGDPGAWQRFDFEVTWVATDEQGEYELDLDCDKGDCPGKRNDFDLLCRPLELEDGQEVLECKGDRLWAGYPFDFQRVR